MSVQAVSWVVEDAPDLPAHLVSTLIGLANHADRDGSGAYPSQSTLAWYARKSDRAVRNDLEALLALSLIRKGNQRLVAHLPADERPVVYDLAMERRRARPTRKDRKPTSAPTQEGPEVGFRAEAEFRPEAQYRGTGSPLPEGTGSPLPTNRPLTVLEPSSSGRSPTVAYIIDATGADDDETNALIQIIKERHRPKSMPAYVRSIPVADLVEMLQEHRAAQRPAAPAKPPLCGNCDANRMVETRSGAMTRCPDCHPLRGAA